MDYVLGFLFSPNRERVLLIEKLKPEWQKGKLNGVGGKIEDGERPLAAMIREFEEEAGLLIEDWQHVALVQGVDWSMQVYCAFDEAIARAEAKTAERLFTIELEDFDLFPIVPNLRFLVPLALDTSGLRKPVVLFDDTP